MLKKKTKKVTFQFTARSWLLHFSL
uniref:Uncharacterized protein n=1 Tax=Arundo donax TaxID=35708 RepID=A0A0A9B8F1_ARUDO